MAQNVLYGRESGHQRKNWPTDADVIKQLAGNLNRALRLKQQESVGFFGQALRIFFRDLAVQIQPAIPGALVEQRCIDPGSITNWSHQHNPDAAGLGYVRAQPRQRLQDYVGVASGVELTGVNDYLLLP